MRISYYTATEAFPDAMASLDKFCPAKYNVPYNYWDSFFIEDNKLNLYIATQCLYVRLRWNEDNQTWECISVLE